MSTHDVKRETPEVVKVISFNLPTEQHAALKALAERNHRTVSQELRMLVDHLLEGEDKAA